LALYGSILLPNRPDPANIQRLDVLPLPFIGKMMRYGMRIDVDHFRALEHSMSERMTQLRKDIVSVIPPDALERFMEVSSGWGDEDDASGTTDDFRNSDTEDEAAGAGGPTLSDSFGGSAGKLTGRPGSTLNALPSDSAFNVESPKQLAELLYDVLGLQNRGVQVKKTKSGDRLNTGKKTLEQLKREHPVVPLILQYRENSKLKGTYAVSLPKRAKLHPKGPNCPLCGRKHYTDEMRVHSQVLTTRTATGRTASKNPNLANIPARSKLGGEIRAGFIASEGCVIAQRDFSQIELRLLADQSGDPRMIAIYLEDGDIHIVTAMGTFNITDPAKVDKLLHRAPSKNTNFAVGYGITGAGLLDLMAVTFATAGQQMPDYMTEQWCEEFIAKWFALYAGVKRFLDREEEVIRRHAISWTPLGRVRRIPEVRSCHEWIQEAGVRQGRNHKIQGYSADLMKLAMGEADERLAELLEYGIDAWPLMTIYDELLIETPEDHGDVLEYMLEDVMDNVLVDKQTGKLCCKVPIKSDGKIMQRWTKE
jgi:DNA polymerase I-like protein with 3'-5' exonuclease and polymerase domains